jgi:two-component system cell cycle response regulator DivK
MGKTILIVEDEPKNMTLTRDLLKISGYETIEARDGKEGVEKAKERNRILF